MSIREPRASKGTNEYIFNYFYGFNAEDLSEVAS